VHPGTPAGIYNRSWAATGPAGPGYIQRLPTVGIVHIGLDGHVNPAARLGTVLARQGRDVLAWAPERYRERIEVGGVEFRPYDPVEGLPLPVTPAGFHATIAEATERSVSRLVEELFETGVDLVVYDCQAPWGRVAATFLGLPRVVSWPLFPGNPHGFLPDDLGATPDELARIEAGRKAIGKSWGVELGSWRTWFFQPEATTLTYTTTGFTGPSDLPGTWCFAGPLMDAVPAADPRPARPVVYAALGTVYNFRAEPFRAVIEGLAEEAVDVVLAVGTSPIRNALGPLPPNVTVHGYVDSRAFLANADVHVTHGGASSVAESLVAGVPMVCVPQGSDHWGWAERVQELGAGTIVEADPEAIRAGVRRLLEEEAPRVAARALRDHFLGYDGVERVRRVFERVLAAEATA
jgi:MGT family glycosyltransferase